ncbi:unnamed protein product [Closterium sp. Yama58-4]|nr:unnamed protein product [Closterium sp. Yama58-4]
MGTAQVDGMEVRPPQPTCPLLTHQRDGPGKGHCVVHHSCCHSTCPPVPTLPVSSHPINFQLAFFESLYIRGVGLAKVIVRLQPIRCRRSASPPSTPVYLPPPRLPPIENLLQLKFFESLHIRGVGLARVIVRRPQLLSSSLDATWQLLIRYLSLLGLTNAQIGEMVVRHPKVLQLTVQADVSPKVRFLRLIGIPEADVAGVLHRFPPILTYSLDKKIRPLVRFLVTEAGVPDHEVWKVVVARPDLVACHLDDRLRPLVRFLLSMGVVREDVGIMVVQFPPLLKYNPAILKPKWRYFQRTMRLTVDHLVAFPR